jgi:TRAP-type uncharacterized transport system substrate-binding protein
MKKIIIKRCILLILILFLLFLLYYSYERKEHYLTYFLPFNQNNSEIINLYNFYKDNINETYYFESKMDYLKIKIGITDKTPISEYMLKIFLGNTNLINGETISYNNRMESINDLISNKINIVISDYISIYYYKYILNKDISNINLITHLNREYLYTFVLKDSNVFSLNDFPPNSVIGILGEPNILYMYIDKLLKDLGYEKNVDYKVKIFNNMDLLFQDLINSKINIIMILDVYPNKNINILLNKYSTNNILLLPFDINNEKVFFQKNSFYYIDYINLNNFSDTYLPKTFGKYNYNINLPDLKSIYIEKIIITNKQLDNLYTYNFIKYYVENLPYLNYIFKNSGYKLDTNFYNNNLTLKYHQGVIKYLIEKGYISYIDHENCKYLIGIMECNEKNLKDNNLFYLS